MDEATRRYRQSAKGRAAMARAHARRRAEYDPNKMNADGATFHCVDCGHSISRSARRCKACSAKARTGRVAQRLFIRCLMCATTIKRKRPGQRFCSRERGFAYLAEAPRSRVYWPTCATCGSVFLARSMYRRHCPADYIDPAEIFERDGWRCQGCGVDTPSDARGTMRDDAPELDHVHPRSRGGGHTRDNLQCLCRRCNRAKGARLDWRAAA